MHSSQLVLTPILPLHPSHTPHSMHNSPKSLFNLLHWQGNDHYENLHRQCHGIVAEMHGVIKAGGITITPPADDDLD